MKVPLVLARLVPLRGHDGGDAVSAAARRRRHRRRRGVMLVTLQLGLVTLASVAGVAVLTGAGWRGDAPVLVGAVAAAGAAEVLRRRLVRDEGIVRAAPHGAIGTPPAPAVVRAPAPVDAGEAAEVTRPHHGDPEPVTRVWSARGAIRRDGRRGPHAHGALPPTRGIAAAPSAARTAGDVGPTPRSAGAVGEEAADPRVTELRVAGPASAERASADDLDLTREVLAALHAGARGA
jgi:hypothetical protein